MGFGIKIIRGHKWEAVGTLKNKLRWGRPYGAGLAARCGGSHHPLQHSPQFFREPCYYSVFKCTKCGTGLEVYIDHSGHNIRWYCGSRTEGVWVSSNSKWEDLNKFECQKRVMENALR